MSSLDAALRRLAPTARVAVANGVLGWRLIWRTWPPVVFVSGLLLPEVFRMFVYTCIAWLAGGAETARFAATGATVLCLGFPCVGMVADFPSTDVVSGTYAPLLRGRWATITHMVFRAPVLLLQGLLVASCVCVSGFLVFGMGSQVLWWFSMCWAFVPCVIGCEALGLCVVAPVAGTRWESSSYNLAIPVLTVLSGTVFDVKLPPVLTLFGDILPMTHLTAALRASNAGRPWGREVLAECAVALGWTLVAALVFRLMDRYSRRTGGGFLRDT